MGAATPIRRKGSNRTRGAILRAAERIFASAGLAGARTEAIAARAGVNKALLYYYFRSKDDIFQAVLEDHLKEFQTRGLEALEGNGPAGPILLRYVSTHFDFISARPYYPRLLQRLMLTGGKPLERLVKEHFLPISRKLIGVIERGVEEGEFHRVDSRHAAISLVGLTVFYFSSAPALKLLSGTDPYEPGELTRRREEVLRFIRYALLRNPEAC